jgi:ribosomal protein S18 acetylase RimI-like enzyme
MNTSHVIRKCAEDDLSGLLNLYGHLHQDDPAPVVTPDLYLTWQKIISDPHQTCLVAILDQAIVSSCVLVIVPNLTRGGRPYGLIENVVTHSAFRKRGIGTEVLQSALALAWQNGCYKVMLMTSRRDQETLSFYESAGFQPGEKTALIAYP